MAISDFTINPCRRNIFDIFQIDKSEIDLRVINGASKNAREMWKYGKLKARDGSTLELSEAELNAMVNCLLNPLERLRAEQFTHQAHHFIEDEQLARCLRRLETETDLMPDLVNGLQESLFGRLIRFLPPLAPRNLSDDLAWPEPPEPCDLTRETLAMAILRDR